MSNLMFNSVLLATWETIYMVFISSVLSITIGLGIGLILFLSKDKTQIATKFFCLTIGSLVNISRSIPYVILMILLIPFTTFLLGTSIGTNASIVPLAIAAIPFYARIAESAISTVDRGLIEAANSMGATKCNIICKVLIPEARNPLISGAALTIISLISYSAMAGAIGGGGLGSLAIQYGYQRFNIGVMLETVIILVILVQLLQALSEYLIKSKKNIILLLVASPLLLGSISQIIYSNMPNKVNTIKIGVMSGPSIDIMQAAKKIAKDKYQINLEIIPFDNYDLPNEALNSGAIDANIFQHKPFLESQIKNRNYKISALGKTYIYPMGFYSSKISNLKQIKRNDIVAIPNDPTNEGRALLLLEKSGLIKLNTNKGWAVTPYDIISNPYHLIFKELDAAQIPRILNQVTMGAITNDFLNLSKPKLTLKNSLLTEDNTSPFVNLMVVRTKDLSNKQLLDILSIMHSPKIINITKKYYPHGASIPGWKH